MKTLSTFLPKIIGLVLLVVFFLPIQISAQEQVKPEELFELSLEELLNISIITSSKKEEKIVKTPASVNIITSEEIKFMNFNTLEELLEYTVGMSSISGEKNFYTATSIRGNTVVNYNVNTLLLYDGIPIYNPYNGSFELSIIPLNSIDRIEIVKGANSVLYGTNAINAVINVISKHVSNNEKKLASIRFKGGSNYNMYAESTILKDYGSYKIGLFSDVNTSKGENLTLRDENGNIETLRDYYKGANIVSKIQYKNFKLHLQYYNRQQPNIKSRGFDYNSFIYESETRSIVVPERHDEFGIVSSLSFNYKYSEKLGIHARSSLWYWDMKKDVYSGYWDQESKAFFNEFEFTITPVKWLSNIVGISSNSMFARRFKSERNAYGIGKDNKWTNDFATYMNGNIDVTKRLILHYGGRYYRSSYKDVTFDDFSPRSAVVFNVRKKLHIKAIYGESFRVPTYFEKEVASVKIIGNPDLQPEKSKSIDFVISDIIKGIQFNIDIFYMEIKDKIARRPYIYDNTKQQNYNVGKENFKGFEFDSKFRSKDSKMIGFVGYSYVLGKNVETNEDLKFTYRNMINLGMNYRICKSISLSSTLKYLDKWGEADSYILLNPGLNFIPTSDEKFEIEFKVDNVLGTDVKIPEIGRNHPDVTTIPVTNIRKFYIGMSYNF